MFSSYSDFRSVGQVCGGGGDITYRKAEPSSLSFEDIDKSYDVIIAIDIGTAYSGYAYAFMDDPQKIFMNKIWAAKQYGFPAEKTLSDVYIDSDGKFHFGFDAQQAFLQQNQKKAGKYFHAVKVHTYHNKKQGFVSVKDVTGKHEEDAIKIFGELLKFFKEHALEHLKETGKNTESLKKRWILTVPGLAEWGDHYKMMMREAALQGGLIDSRQSPDLKIALEPEVAALYCRTLKVEQFDNSGDHFNAEMKDGEPYMIIDAGGGTVDFAYQLALAKGCSEDIMAPDGVRFGGNAVRVNFEQLLCKIFGETFLSDLLNADPTAWEELMGNFGLAKRNMKEITDPLIVQVPASVPILYDKIHGPGEFEKVANSKTEYFDFPNGTYLGRLVLKPDVAKKLFADAAVHTVDHADDQVRVLKGKGSNLKYVYLVGGFAQSLVMKEMLKERLPSDIKLAIPAEPAGCVLRGAVMYGLQPKLIQTLKLRNSYALGIYKNFNSAIHQSKWEKNGLVEELLPIFKQGESIEYNQKMELDVVPALGSMDGAMQRMVYPVYSVFDTEFERKHPKSLKKDRIKKIGMINVETPDVAKITFVFAGTEMQVIVTDAKNVQLRMTLSFDFDDMSSA